MEHLPGALHLAHRQIIIHGCHRILLHCNALEVHSSKSPNLSALWYLYCKSLLLLALLHILYDRPKIIAHCRLLLQPAASISQGKILTSQISRISHNSSLSPATLPCSLTTLMSLIPILTFSFFFHSYLF